MKKWIAALLAGVLALTLAACGAGESKAVWTVDHGRDILDSGAFSEELEELDMDTAWMLYKLGDSGLDRESLTGGLCRRSAGATCEELAVLIFDSQESAEQAEEALKDYVQGQIAANRDYRPAEISKLEGAWLERRGYTLLLVVAGDLEAAQTAVGE